MRFLLGACALIWVVSATATPNMTAETPLTMSQAIALVLENNPQLQAADFDNRAAANRVLQQSQTTPWELGIELENLAGTSRESGPRNLETTLSLGRVLERGNKAHLRGEVAHFELGALRHDQDVQRLDLLAEAASRFLDIIKVQAERELGMARVELMQRTLDAVNKRIRIGKSASVERNRVEINLAKAELELEETDHLLANGRRQLSVMWGELEPGFNKAQAELFQLHAEPDFTTLEQRIEQNPLLARLATAERLANAKLRLARAKRKSNVGVRVGMRHLNASDDLALTLSMRIPLGSETRARSYISEADNLLQREPFLAQQQRLALHATLFELHQELLHTRDRLTVYQKRIIPAAEKALADYSQGYAAGRYSLWELTSAQETLLEARSESLSAATEHHKIGIEIIRLIGATPATGVYP